MAGEVLTEDEAVLIVQVIMQQGCRLSADQKVQAVTAVLDRCEATGGRVTWPR